MAMRLEPLTMSHADELLLFERENRAFFAQHVGDRGDAYFDQFDQRLAALIAECDAGTTLAFVVVNDKEQIVGRANIADTHLPEHTEIGFRVGQSTQKQGVAKYVVTAALLEAKKHGVRQIRARAQQSNIASQRVLTSCGFAATGVAEPPPGAADNFLGFRISL